jgi:hypothetical protein
MPCETSVKYRDYVLVRDHPNDATPSFMTPIDYTLETICTVQGCKHLPELMQDLVLDFNEQGVSYTHEGAPYVARPRTDNFTYLGPLRDDPLTRKGKLTMTSEYGWMSIKTTMGKTGGSSQGAKVKSGGSTSGTKETSTTR